MPALHISSLLQDKKNFQIQCTSPLAQLYLVAQYALKNTEPVVLLLPDESLFQNTTTILNEWVQGVCPVLEWKSWEASPYLGISPSLAERNQRLQVLEALCHSRPSIVVVGAQGLHQPTLPSSLFIESSFLLALGEDLIDHDSFATRLKNMGYVRTDMVTDVGQFSVRGEIIDLFSPQNTYPIRITLFDTEIESIKFFNPETQTSLHEKQNEGTTQNTFWVVPSEEALFSWDHLSPQLEIIKSYCDERSIHKKTRDPIFENIRNGFLPENFRYWIPFLYPTFGRLSDYIKNQQIFVLEPEKTKEQIHRYLAQFKSESEHYDLNLQDHHQIVPDFSWFFSAEQVDVPLPKYENQFQIYSHRDSALHTLETELLPVHDISFKLILDLIEQGFSVYVGSKNYSQKERIEFELKELIQQEVLPDKIKITNTSISENTILTLDQIAFISESALLKKFSRLPPTQHKKNQTFQQDSALSFLSTQELLVNDYVVHSLHGIGKFLGLVKINQDAEEYLLIEYARGDKLYLPIYRLNVIQKHVGSHANPTLDKLGGNQFEKAKDKARDSAKKLAINLIELYAKRALVKGPKIFIQDDLFDQFCDQFPYTETEGQTAALQDILSDFEQGKLLDRLVCGDVGFGKTEVAMRAAFLAVQSGYQVAVLAPTTLLSFQHEQTFKSRMGSFPIKVESISRFKSTKIQKTLLQDTEHGKIDILIGTHRLLSKDVRWAKLGLLIIDEEHRFGVEHKEKIKSIQENIHTLTLTATPIPRTLNQAFSGIKDISLMKAPPLNRLPIKTFVARYSNELVMNAIQQEVQRGGQVFYLYNRVQTIENFAEELRSLIPHVKIIVAHGQMSEGEMESKMIEFYQGHAQVLVCTTIIESGIDIPNAGTILIHRADQLGLAQLYQIRGRVGRSQKRSFAYLFMDEEKEATQEARQRLEALQRFVDLGSGFQIASEDLEIRGGGNLLGAEQSGHIASVGLELFTELLNEAIQELHGKTDSVEDRHFEPEIKTPVVSEIPQTYISDIQTRVKLYRRLSQALSFKQVDEIRNEISERFGPTPKNLDHLFWVIKLKLLAKLTKLESISISVERTTLSAKIMSEIQPECAIQLASGPKNIRDPRVQLIPPQKINITMRYQDLKTHYFELEKLLRKLAPKVFENSLNVDKLSL